MNIHQLSREHFALLARGDGDVQTIEFLRTTELGRRILLFHHLLDLLEGDASAVGVLASSASLRNDLIQVRRLSPSTLDDLLLEPQTGVWLSHSIRRMRSTQPHPAPLWVDLGRLHAITLVAHARADMPYTTQVSLRGNAVMLPSLGLAQFSTSTKWGVAEASTDGQTIVLCHADETIFVDLAHPAVESAKWLPLRRIEAVSEGGTLRITLDDIDPFRNFANPVEPDRLPDSEFQSWQTMLSDAWKLLDEYDPRSIPVVAALLHSVTPLPSADEWIWTTRSGSTGDAFGAAIIAPPSQPIALAEALVHEFQHNKFGALLHLVTLCRDDGRECHYAPWRDDPRPLEGLLHGIYAFTGITRFWRNTRSASVDAHHAGPFDAMADYQFSLWRRQVQRAIQTARECDSLTPLGEAFLESLSESLDCWCAEPVNDATDKATELIAADHSARWRIRHLRSDPVRIQTLNEHFRRHDLSPVEIPKPKIIADPTPWSHARTALYRDRTAMPDEFNDVLLRPRDFERRHSGATASDLALATGSTQLAADAYTLEILSDPERLDAWVGLGLALSQLGDTEASHALLEHPELVKSMYIAHKRKVTRSLLAISRNGLANVRSNIKNECIAVHASQSRDDVLAEFADALDAIDIAHATGDESVRWMFRGAEAL